MNRKLFNQLSKAQKADHLIAKHSFKSLVDNQFDFIWYPYELTAFYFLSEDGKYIAVDNRTGDCWVEEFKTATEAFDYIHDID